MGPDHPRRALPEVLAPGGFDGLLPTTASGFVTARRLVLPRAGTAAALEILDARRAHLAGGTGWLEVDLPAGCGSDLAIRARTIGAAVAGEQIERITVEIVGSLDADVDHWSLDLDHDGVVHRTAITGEGPPPSRIVGEAASHDAGRGIALRVVDRRGLVVTSETGIPPRGW